MASFVFNLGAHGLLSGGSIAWATDVIKARLVASSATPDKDNTTMTGLTGIGTDQTLVTPTKSAANNALDRVVFTATGTLTWAAVASGTVGNVVIYKFVTNDAGSTPIACIDVTDVTANGSDLTLTPDATNGYFYTQQ